VGVVSIQTAEQRLTALLLLRRRVDAAIAELADKSPRRVRRRDYIPPCGTEQAYQRHRYYGEARDEACKAAHRLHNRARKAS
jgi:hypothetical protein